MLIEHVYKGVRYTLSNENLAVGNEVFPIAWGRQTKEGWILHNLDYRKLTSSFPDEPHTITSIEKVSPVETIIRTHHGYSPAESYYKIIKREKQIKESERIFASWIWVEITADEVSEAEAEFEKKEHPIHRRQRLAEENEV
jgi:hypothetical protein